MTEFLMWREAARLCTRPEYRINFVRAIDDAQKRFNDFTMYPDSAGLAQLQSSWSHAHRLYITLPLEGTPAPRGGSTEPTKFAA